MDTIGTNHPLSTQKFYVTIVSYNRFICLSSLTKLSNDIYSKLIIKFKYILLHLFQSADILSLLCVLCIHVHVCMNNFSKITRPRDMLFFFKKKPYLSLKNCPRHADLFVHLFARGGFHERSQTFFFFFCIFLFLHITWVYNKK